jgi:hypothetical protein
MVRALALGVLALCLGGQSASAQAGELARLGDVGVSYDPARWQVLNVQGEGLHFRERSHSYMVRMFISPDDGKDCSADRLLHKGRLMSGTKRHPTEARFGTVTGLRFEVDIGCRNWVEPGIALCVKHRAKFYILASVPASCRASLKKSVHEALVGEIAAGANFQ